MRKLKMLIRGGYGLFNFGDDALMYTLNQFLSNRTYDLYYWCTNEKYITKLIGKNKIISTQRKKTNKYDILIYGGGTQFYSFPLKKSKLSKIISNINKPKELKRIFLHKINEIAQKLIQKQKFQKLEDSKKIGIVATIGVGIGPFNSLNSDIEIKTKKLFQELNWNSVRDNNSLKICKDWKIEAIKYTDICYALNHSKFSQKILKPKSNRIGVIVRDWDYSNEGKSYYPRVVNVVKKLRDKGFQVYYISFSKLRDKEWIKYLQKENEDYIQWNPETTSINSFINILNSFDLFITARYHGAVFSALLNIPFITIVIEPKLKIIPNEIGINDIQFWDFPFNSADCLGKVDYLFRHYSQIVNIIHQYSESQSKLAKRMFRDFNYFIETEFSLNL